MKYAMLAAAALMLSACATDEAGDKTPLSAEEYALLACSGYKYSLAVANEADKLGLMDEDAVASMLDAIALVDGRCSGETPPADVIGPATLAISLLAYATEGE